VEELSLDYLNSAAQVFPNLWDQLTRSAEFVAHLIEQGWWHILDISPDCCFNICDWVVSTNDLGNTRALIERGHIVDLVKQHMDDGCMDDGCGSQCDHLWMPDELEGLLELLNRLEPRELDEFVQLHWFQLFGNDDWRPLAAQLFTQLPPLLAGA
jgi:hypothetical protein